MKPLRLWCVFFILGGLISIQLIGQSPEGTTSEPPLYKDGIAARVNGEIITYSELSFYTKQLRRDKKKVLKALIENKLVLQAAKREEVKITDKELDKRLERIIETVGGKEAFEKMFLTPLKTAYEQYREDLRQDMAKEKYITMKIHGQPRQNKSSDTDFVIDTFVSPKEIRDYFEEHKAAFTGESKVKTRQIILRFEDKIMENSKKAVGDALVGELEKGASFEKLAQEFSDVNAAKGGLWDYIPKGTFSKEVEDVIFKLKVGEISPLIKTKKDFRIIKIEDRIDPVENADSPEVQNRIKKILRQRKIQEGVVKLRNKLVEKANIWVDPALDFSWETSSENTTSSASQK